MANWQDIRKLEEQIYDVVQEFIDNSDAYNHAVLRVYLDRDIMVYKAEIDENLEINEDDGIYAIKCVIRDGENGLEPDVDRISAIANSWIFLD